MKLLLMLALAVSADGARSLDFGAGSTASMTFPSASPWTAVGPYTGALRLHGFTTPAAIRTIVSAPAFRVHLSAQGEVCLENQLDAMPAYSNRMCGLITGMGDDVAVSWQRDTVGLLWKLRVWNIDTGAQTQTYCGTLAIGSNVNQFDCPIGTVSGSAAGAASLGVASVTANLAFLKMTSGLAQIVQPTQQYDTADLIDWRLEDNGTDNSGRSLNLTVVSPAYVATPALGPFAVARTQLGAMPESAYVTMRAGRSNVLSGAQSYARGDSETLTYAWTQISGPTIAVWSTRTTVTPSVSQLTFGTYVLRLTVTDVAGLKSSNDLRVGSVAMDSNGVVVNADSRVQAFLGPQIAFGHNPWPWADDRHKYFADFFGGLLTTFAAYQDTWHGPAENLADFTNGSPTVTRFSGPAFTTLMTDCPASAGADGDVLVANIPATNGVKFLSARATACSADSITLGSNFTGATGRYVWGSATKAQQFQYANGSQNMNYYDVALAQLSMYYRSGDSAYREYARQLVRKWWTAPGMNRGLQGLNPRLTSPAGMVMCMVLLDDCAAGDPNMTNFWTDFDGGNENGAVFIFNNWWPADGREEAARFSSYALSARWSPDATNRTNFTANLVTGWTAKWVANYEAIHPGLGLVDPPLAPASDNSLIVSVQNGSTAVVTNGGSQFTAGMCAGVHPGPNILWFYVSATVFDREGYNCTFNSSSSITLERAYEGTTHLTKRMSANNLVGPIVSPWINGWMGTMYKQLHDLGITGTTASYIRNIVNYGSTRGYFPASQGMYYYREGPGCEPIGASLPTASLQNCTDADFGPEGSRFLPAEVLNTYSWDALINGAPAQTLEFGDIYYGGNYGKLGGPQTSNGYHYTAFNNNGLVEFSKKAKDFGYAYGLGLGATWPAARLGGVQPTANRTINVMVDPAAFAEANSVKVILTFPSAATTSTVCNTAGVCAVVADATQGDHLVVREYWSGANATGRVLASSSTPAEVAMR